MIILDIEGLSLTSEDKEVLQHPSVAGVIYFARNFESPAQIADLSKQIKQLRPDLLISVDQEGGRVQRFVNGFTRLPPLGILGKLEDLKLSEQVGTLMALEVLSVGVDLSFAPIVDLDKGVSSIIGNRAFHRDPKIVTALAAAYIKGMQKAGMQATIKHFPGHGSVALDSHIGLPVDERKFTEIAEDLAPFKNLAHQGINAIMTAHIIFPQIDQKPVSFSKKWLSQILRQELGYEGAIISDDLSMGGAQSLGNYATRANEALQAGCDLILVCNHRQGAIEIMEQVAFKPEPISKQRINKLLATNTAPDWKELKETALWIEAKKALSVLEVSI